VGVTRAGGTDRTQTAKPTTRIRITPTTAGRILKHCCERSFDNDSREPNRRRPLVDERTGGGGESGIYNNFTSYVQLRARMHKMPLIRVQSQGRIRLNDDSPHVLWPRLPPGPSFQLSTPFSPCPPLASPSSSWVAMLGRVRRK